jgi:hypothetical protein
VVAAGAVAATVLLRRRAAARRERVDLYFDDGSMLSLAEGTGDAERLLPLAREVLRAAGS